MDGGEAESAIASIYLRILYRLHMLIVGGFSDVGLLYMAGASLSWMLYRTFLVSIWRFYGMRK